MLINIVVLSLWVTQLQWFSVALLILAHGNCHGAVWIQLFKALSAELSVGQGFVKLSDACSVEFANIFLLKKMYAKASQIFF